MQTTDDILFSAHGPDPIPSATTEVVGTPGNALNVYWIVSHFPIGSVVSGPFPQKSAPNVLDDENYVHISWLATLGALSYDLLFTRRLELPKQPGNFALALNLTDTEFRDQGQSLSEYDLAGIRYGAPQQEWIFFDNRDRKQPTLRFIPWPIEVSSIIFEDGTSQNTAGGGGQPASPDRSVQFNNSGVFGGNANFVYSTQGHVGVGDPNPRAKLTVVNDNQPARGVESIRYADDLIPATLFLAKARGSLDNPQSVQVGDLLGYLGFGGFVTNLPGGYYPDGATILAVCRDVSASDLAADLVFSTNDGFGVAGNAIERMRITGGGFVGIATQNPQAPLDVAGANPAAPLLRLAGDNAQPLFTYLTIPDRLSIADVYGAVIIADIRYYAGAIGFINTGMTISVNDATGGSSPKTLNLVGQNTGGVSAQVRISSDNTIRFLTEDVERMRIDSQGNVGIGTSNPQAALDVNGNIFASGVIYGFGGEIRVIGGGAQPGLFVQSDVSLWGIKAPGSLTGLAGYFQINDELHSIAPIVIDPSGRVGIMNTFPQATLDVNGDFRIVGPAGGAGSVFSVDNFDTLNITTNVSSPAFVTNLLTGGSLVVQSTGANLTISGLYVTLANVNSLTVTALFTAFPNLRNTEPVPGSKELWYDPADGNIVKFAA